MGLDDNTEGAFIENMGAFGLGSTNPPPPKERQEDSAQCRKINCECMKRKPLFETQEESAQRKKTMRVFVTKQ